MDHVALHEELAPCPFCGSEQTHLIAVQVDAGQHTDVYHAISIVAGEDGRNIAIPEPILGPLTDHCGSSVAIWRSCEWNEHHWIEVLHFHKGDTHSTKQLLRHLPTVGQHELWRS